MHHYIKMCTCTCTCMYFCFVFVTLLPPPYLPHPLSATGTGTGIGSLFGYSSPLSSSLSDYQGLFNKPSLSRPSAKSAFEAPNHAFGVATTSTASTAGSEAPVLNQSNATEWPDLSASAVGSSRGGKAGSGAGSSSVSGWTGSMGNGGMGNGSMGESSVVNGTTGGGQSSGNTGSKGKRGGRGVKGIDTGIIHVVSFPDPLLPLLPTHYVPFFFSTFNRRVQGLGMRLTQLLQHVWYSTCILFFRHTHWSCSTSSWLHSKVKGHISQ